MAAAASQAGPAHNKSKDKVKTMWKRKCFYCGKPFETASISGRYCSNKCKQKDYRDRKAAGETPATTKGPRKPAGSPGRTE